MMTKNRRNFIKHSATGAIALIGGISSPITSLSHIFPQSDTIQPGHYLFFDDNIILRKHDVRLTVNQCRKLDSPVIAPDKSWEQDRVYTYGSVYKDHNANYFSYVVYEQVEK